MKTHSVSTHRVDLTSIEKQTLLNAASIIQQLHDITEDTEDIFGTSHPYGKVHCTPSQLGDIALWVSKLATVDHFSAYKNED